MKRNVLLWSALLVALLSGAAGVRVLAHTRGAGTTYDIEEWQALQRQWEDKILQPGWVVISYDRVIAGDTGQDPYVSWPLPNKARVELWVYIDANGHVAKDISRTVDLERPEHVWVSIWQEDGHRLLYSDGTVISLEDTWEEAHFSLEPPCISSERYGDAAVTLEVIDDGDVLRSRLTVKDDAGPVAAASLDTMDGIQIICTRRQSDGALLEAKQMITLGGKTRLANAFYNYQVRHEATLAPEMVAYLNAVQPAASPFQPQSLAQDGMTVTLAWVYADRERLSVEYTLDGLPIPEKYRHDCPVLETRLYDEAGNLLASLPGDDGYCLQDGQRVVQTFRPLPLPAAEDELSFALEIVLGGTVYPDGRFVDAPKEPVTLPEISPFRFAVHVPVQSGLTFPETQTVESAGRAVQVGDVEMYASLTAATVCADLPDAGDWLPVAELRLGDSVTPSDSLTLLDADSAATYTASHRCFRLTFPRGWRAASLAAFDIVVTRLARSVPELPTPENCRKAQERLQKSHPEVAFECLAEGQGMGVHVTRKPEGMREEQALTLAWDAFRESVFGPWATAWPAP